MEVKWRFYLCGKDVPPQPNKNWLKSASVQVTYKYGWRCIYLFIHLFYSKNQEKDAEIALFDYGAHIKAPDIGLDNTVLIFIRQKYRKSNLL